MSPFSFLENSYIVTIFCCHVFSSLGSVQKQDRQVPVAAHGSLLSLLFSTKAAVVGGSGAQSSLVLSPCGQRLHFCAPLAFV